MVVLFEDIKDFLTARGGPAVGPGGTGDGGGAPILLTGRRRRRMIGAAAGVLHGAGHRAGGRVVCRGVHKAYFLRLLNA